MPRVRRKYADPAHAHGTRLALHRLMRSLVLVAALVACNAEPAPSPAVPDAAIDAPDYLSHCPACGSGSICVIDFGGVRQVIGARCAVSTCEYPACTPECDALCKADGDLFQCADSTMPLPPGYFGCYGP